MVDRDFIPFGWSCLLMKKESTVNRYPIRPLRARQVLDGSWQFHYLGDVAPETVAPESLNYQDIAAVPGCYDTAGELIGKRGVAVYRTAFEFASGRTRLTIGGLGLYARLYLDGVFLREVKTPYATITQDFDCSAGEHHLAIVLDNRFDPARVPLFKPYYDFYGYGGIYRSVILESLPALRLERAPVRTLDLAAGRVQVTVECGGALAAEVTLRYRFDRSPEQTLTLPVQQGRATFEAVVPDFRVWSPEAPHLHTIRLGLVADGREVDTLVERFGLRTIAARGQDLLLNNQPLYLCGVNRHEAHPELGPVQPVQIMVDDLKWVKELGANFVRGAHYQQNPEFLECCDEAGVLVWNESLAWGLLDCDSDRPESVELLRESTAVMAAECVNNPSVILCGFLNECNTDTPSGRAMHAKMAEAVRQHNPHCLVSYAGNRFQRDTCTDLVDVISVNPYPGWISHLDGDGSDYRKDIPTFFDDIAQQFSAAASCGKPLLVSESGACGIYGIRDRARAQWSEEFQSDYFAAAIGAVFANPRYCGVTLWQMFDCRSFVNTGQVRCKPRGYNCAGLLDEYRRPKLVFDTVKQLFHQRRGKA